MRKHPLALCENCTLKDEPYVPSTLTASMVYFVGEAPGFEEARASKPFVGPSGTLLRATLEGLGYNNEEYNYVNVVSCRPLANRVPTIDEIACCMPRLKNELRYANRIIALGKVAAEVLIEGYDYRNRGVPLYFDGVQIHTTWHPSYVLRKETAFRQFNTDLRRALGESRFIEQPEIVIVNQAEQLMELIQENRNQPKVAWDLETDQTQWYDKPDKGKDPILMMSFAFNTDTAYIIPGGTPYQYRPYTQNEETKGWGPLYTGAMPQALKEFFNQKWEYGAHNGNFDKLFTKAELGIMGKVTFDTMLAHYVLCEVSPHDLKSLATEYFGVGDYEQELVLKYLRKKSDWYSKVPFGEFARYAGYDAVITRAFMDVFECDLMREGLYEKPFRLITQPLQQPAFWLEHDGWPIDIPHLEKVGEVFHGKMDELQIEIREMCGNPDHNPNSTQQNARVIWEQRELPKNTKNPLYRRGKKDSTAWVAIEHLASINRKSGIKVRDGDPFIDLIMHWKSIQKRMSTYVWGVIAEADIEHRVHPTVNIHGTEVTRRSIVRPPTQTIPRPGSDPYGVGPWLRSGFIADKGWVLVDVDYSAAELRAITAESKDPFWIKVFVDGLDPHGEAAKETYGPNFTKEQRVMAKMLNFADVYSGGNPMAVAQDAGMPIAAVLEIFKRRKLVMPDYYAWMHEQFMKMKRDGYVQNRFGYKRRFPLITARNLDEARKSAVHAQIAGGVACLTGLSWIELQGKGIPFVHEMHDSLIAHVPQDEALEVKVLMETVMRSKAEEYYPEVPWAVDGDIKERWTPLPESF